MKTEISKIIKNKDKKYKQQPREDQLHSVIMNFSEDEIKFWQMKSITTHLVEKMFEFYSKGLLLWKNLKDHKKLIQHSPLHQYSMSWWFQCGCWDAGCCSVSWYWWWVWSHRTQGSSKFGKLNITTKYIIDSPLNALILLLINK